MELDEMAEVRVSSRNGIQVIARAAAVLRTLKGAPSGLSLGQIAERVGLPRSTVQRIVQTLHGERLLIISGAAGGVQLGPELLALAEAARYSVVERCRPVLRSAVEETGETTDLSVLGGGRMIFLDQIQGTKRLRTVSSVGEAFPLTTTANGRACLSMLPDVEGRRLAENEWRRLGLPANWRRLKHNLTVARSRGLAEDNGDHTDGISALGFAFTDHVGDLHAISIPVPTPRFAEQKETVQAALLRVKAEILRIFGR